MGTHQQAKGPHENEINVFPMGTHQQQAKGPHENEINVFVAHETPQAKGPR
eukprot:CAMPEP_0194338100 /NCGR_PEP_ID=MMETSP0171-20130528/78397_1 /TAXON_ID=218684 /ORGANISM="Corethron pennatum, Strain L29A3" /LENGTH=50 /DNA_ID=CAMNT_0039102103 /DNA_START=96 /DNA_END=245 /DNA_ORIENTATION=-